MDLSGANKVGRLIVGSLAAVTIVALWRTREGPAGPVLWTAQPQGVMGTECRLAVRGPATEAARAKRGLAEAERELRGVEARMSVHLESSEVSRLNRAPAGVLTPLSGDVLKVLRAARDAADSTDGAFDATCRPLLLLWKNAARENRLRTPAEFEAARAQVGWSHLELAEGGARKRLDAAGVDLGGIAKGYAVDRAVEAMRAAGCRSGMVDVGGDLRCFGPGPADGFWEVELRHPFRAGSCATLRIADVAVCTSGNYQRFFEVAGRRYSRIVDPRSGTPAGWCPSVTVIAPTCMVADIWATALSVLDLAGLKRVPAGVEALIVSGAPESGYHVYQTEGFGRWLATKVDLP